MAATVESLRVEYASRIAAQAKADQDALLGMAKAMETVGTKTQATDEVLKRASQTHGRIVTQIDGVAAATKRLEAAETSHASKVAAVSDAYRRGTLSLEQAQKEITKLNVLYDQATQRAIAHGQTVEARFAQVNTALTTTGAVTQKFTGQTNQASNAIRQLGIQSIDVFQQLASGAPVLTTFIQQGGQVGQVMAVSGTSIGTVTRAIGGFIAANAGVIGAAAGMIGFGAAVYSVFQRSSDLEAQQRQLSVAIAGTGRSAELSAGQMAGYVTQLKQQGVAAAEATTAIAALARNPSLSQSMIGRIAGIGPDAAAALGVSVPDAMKQLADGAKGGIDGITKLDEAFNVLTASEMASVRAMIEHGEKGAALTMVFDKLQGQVAGLNREALSPMEQAFRDMGNAWDGFMTKVVNSGPVVAVMSQLARNVRSISGALFGNTGAELSQEIVGVGRQIKSIEDALASETGSGRLADQRRQSMNAALAEYRAREQSLIDRARSEVTPGASVGAAITVPDASKSLASQAYSDASKSDNFRIQSLTKLNEKYREEQKKLGPVVNENKELFETYTNAIAANEKSIEDLNKKNETHRTGLEKTGDTYDAQIAAALRLTAAYATSREAVAKVTATREAEAKAITGGLIRGTKRYADEVQRLTGQILELRRLEGQGKVAEQIRDANEQADAQERIANAYDGTAESITRATNEEKAFATVRDKLKEGSDEAAAAQRQYANALNRSADASKALDHAQRSVSAIMDTLATAADRVGQAIVDAFVSGSGAAVNLGNILKGVAASIVSDFAKLAFLNPIRNAAFGGSAPTLSAGLGVLTGGVSGQATGGLNIMNAASNASTFGGITDALGLTDFAGKLSGIGEYLGLTGSNGMLGGLGSGISSFLTTGINGVGLGAATNTALAGLGAGVYGPAAPASVLAAQGGATIGGMLSGVGLGFGAGSLAGGLLQSSLGKVGPAPMIGAGAGSIGGALAGTFLLPGIGTVLGGLLGGLLGGGGGGLIGPKEANAFSATGLNATDGMLSVGRTFSQIVDVSQEVAALQQQTAQINSVLAASNLRIANGFSADEFGQARIIGGNSGEWLNFGQGDGRPGSIADAFGELRFSSTESTLNRALQNKAFANLEELQSTVARITTFVNDTAPALIALGKPETTYGVGSLAATLEELNKQYDAAISMARDLGHEEDALSAARTNALAAAQKSVDDAINQSKAGFDLRFWQAKATNDNDPRLAFDASLVAFDIRAKQEKDSFSAQLLAMLGDAGKTSSLYLDQMAQLDRTLYQERLTLLTQFNAQVIQADRTRAAQWAQINSVLAATNLRIANGVSADNFGQGDGRPGSIADAFGELRFSSENDTVNRYLSGRSFENLETLQAKVTEIITFVDQIAPALIALGKTETTYGVGSLAATITELTRQFDDAIATARELGHEEDALTAARASAIATAEKSVNDTMDRSKMGFDLRFWQAKATNDNDPRLAFDASLVAFDARATQERDAFSAQLLGILGDAGKASSLYIDQMAQLDRVLYEERLTLLTQFNSQAVQADRLRAEQSALAVITSISDYSQSLAYSDMSPLNARDQYRSALSDFRSISEGVGTGDFNALSQLPAAANQLLTSSRGLFGSGQQYATDFASVQAVLRGAVSQSPEAIVAAAIQASEATQTAVLGSLMEQMVARLDALLAEARLQAMRQAA